MTGESEETSDARDNSRQQQHLFSGVWELSAQKNYENSFSDNSGQVEAACGAVAHHR